VSDAVVERVRLAAYAWAERDGAVLLVRIAPSELGAGSWTLPGGGLAFGEDPATGVLRELVEETGLEGEVGALLGVRSAMLEPGITKRGDRIQAVGILYRVVITGGELRPEVDESTDLAAWIPFEAIDSLPTVPLVTWARTVVGA
jgi:ADP-ribose pyrophosphatase YjhB (NUDIX family)